MPLEFWNKPSLSLRWNFFGIENCGDFSNWTRLLVPVKNLTHLPSSMLLLCNVFKVSTSFGTDCWLCSIDIMQTWSGRNWHMINVWVAKFLVKSAYSVEKVSFKRRFFRTFILPLWARHSYSLVIILKKSLKFNKWRKGTIGSSRHHRLSDSFLGLRVIQVLCIARLSHLLNSSAPIFVISDMFTDCLG